MGNSTLFKKKMVVINVGLKSFGEGVREQAVAVAHVSWRPGVSKEIKKLLGKVL